MSDSDESTVTYTEVSSPFEGLSDIGSPGVVRPEHEGLPWILDDPYVQVALQAPPSPAYILGLEEPQPPPLPDFVLEPVYPEYIPQEDDVFLAEEQPLPAAASPTAQSPDYVLESNPKEDPEEDDNEDPEEDPVDYPTNGGDDGDDEDESLEDDEDDYEVDIKADDDEEEEEYPAPADSTGVTLPAADQAPSAKETEPFKTDDSAATPPPHPTYRVTARISIPALVPTPVRSDAEVARLLAISTLPSSPLSPWSTPLAQIPFPPLPLIPSPSLPLSPPLLVSAPPPASPIHPPDAPSSGTPPWLLPSTNRREDRLEVTLSPRKRADYGFVATTDREIRRDLERDVGYGITDSWDEIVEAIQGTPVITDVAEFSQGMTEFETKVRRDTEEVMSLRTTVLAQQSKIRELQSADYRRQTGITKMLAADHRRQKQFTEALKLMKGLQTQMKMEPKIRTTRLNPETTPTATAATTTTVTNAQLQAMIDQGVTAVLAARDANRNGVDSHNSGTGARRNKRATRECTYPDFMKCQPLNFKGTEGVVELTQWIEKMETVFRISNCFVENQIKFSICTLLGNALTWWNSHVRTVGNDITYAMTWTELKKKMTNKMFLEESDKIEKYVGGLPDMIHESVVASKPKTMQEATEMAIEVIDKRIHTFTDRQTENKRKQDNNQQPQQQHQNKRQNTGRAYAAGTVEKKQYGGSKPLCSKCNYHHDGPCAPKCHKCNKVGDFARDYRSKTNDNNDNNQKGTGSAKVYAVRHPGTNPDSNIMTGRFLLNNRYASALDHYYDVELADGRIIGLNTILRGCTLNLLNYPFNIDLMLIELGSFDAIIGMDWLINQYQSITQKKVKFEWGDKQETTFQLLKKKLCSAPILALPEGSEDFNRILTAMHRSKVWALLLMQREEYHKSLQHILNQKELNMRQHRWLEFLSDYELREFSYHLEKANVVADRLLSQDEQRATTKGLEP
ncbi:hypothetical protein Tco_1329511 [Tanacetum coccineum]